MVCFTGYSNAVEQDRTNGPRGSYRKGQLQRARLLDSATAVFERRGGDLTLGDVGEQAGVSRESVRHYFPTVADLLLAMQEQRDREAEAGGGDAPLDQRIAAEIRSAHVTRGSAALTAILTASAVIDTEGRVGQAMRVRLARLRSSLGAAVRAAQEAGEFRDDIEAELLARLLLAASQGLAAQILIEGDDAAGVSAAQAALIRLLGPPDRHEG